MYYIFYAFILLISVVLLFALFTVFCSIAVNTKKEYNKDNSLYRFVLNAWTGMVIPIARIKLAVSGLEKIPSDCNFLLVGNHRSNFDPILTWYVLRKYRIAFISKEENFHVPVFGRIIRKLCFMPIDRKNPRNAMKVINRAAGLLMSSNVSIGIYPEGTRNKTEDPLLPFHNGVFKIAQKANAPIVVVTLKDTEKIAKNFPFRSTKVIFDVSDVIPADYVTASDTAEIGERVRQSMLKSLNCNDSVTIQ